MAQIGIPYYFMRGGSSRGPYFKRQDLPNDLDHLSEVLISAVGSGHPLNIDGIGGGNAVTTKVAMLSLSNDEWADIDYFFAQVSVEDRLVDYKPTCGNILAGVGAAAIEMGLVKAENQMTSIKIRSINTNAKITAHVQTPNNQVKYDGSCVIDGVPGSAAPVELEFLNVAGSSTGAFLPTGNLIDKFDDIEVTCMDVAMPLVIARAKDFGLIGTETVNELNHNNEFFTKMERVRLAAGQAMGMGDCSKSVTPKFGLMAPHKDKNHVIVRYFMPWKTHPSMAVTGGQCLASCALTPGTIADGMMQSLHHYPSNVTLLHPSGKLDVKVAYEIVNNIFQHYSTTLTRTCRKLAQGQVFIPESIWRLSK